MAHDDINSWERQISGRANLVRPRKTDKGEVPPHPVAVVVAFDRNNPDIASNRRLVPQRHVPP